MGPGSLGSIAARMLLLMLIGTILSVLGCKTDLDCSLNGICTAAGACVCDKPWKGDACGVLGYKVTPKSGLDLFPINRSHNTCKQGGGGVGGRQEVARGGQRRRGGSGPCGRPASSGRLTPARTNLF